MKTITTLISILALSLSLNADYICSIDQSFQNWLTQGDEVDNGTQLTKYSDLNSCKSQCKKTAECSFLHDSSYSCGLYSEKTELGGDLGPNGFSNQSECNSKCSVQHSCVAWNDDPNCTPTSFEKLNPVSDWTGKTVFTKYNIAWRCKNTERLEGGCLEYKTKVIEDDTTFDLSGIGWESKEFNGFDESMTAIAGMEQFQHIWSGWDGMCESGTKFDSSFLSDPMTLLSFATMAYSGALDSGYGDAVKEATEGAREAVVKAYDAAADQVSIAMTGNTTAMNDTLNSLNSPGLTVLEPLGALPAESFFDTELISETAYSRAVTYGSATMDAALLAMAALSEPEEDHFKMADDFMKAQLGAADASVAAVNYAQCMASIGLSFPNMVGFGLSDEKAKSIELKEPWTNIISLSDNQLAELMKATSESFVRATYLLQERDPATGIGRYRTVNSLAYTQAGQIICGNGKVALATNINNQRASDNSGINTEALAMQALSTGLSYLPPPYNLVASIALKVFTALSKGNACTDEDIAMKWGIQQFKTNKAFRFKQCHYIQSECAAKWFWGSCMRTRNFYCCYDQEMTRIFVEGVKEQIPRGWYRNQCSDLQITDLQNISFRKCLQGESPTRDKCFPAGKWAELNSAIKKQAVKGFDAESLTDMAIDSMPIADDPWGPRIGD